MNENKKAGDKRSFQTTADWAKEHYETNFLPIVFHNLKPYNAHFVVKYFKRKYTQVSRTQRYNDISVIPLNCQKYLQFHIADLCFLDSLHFSSTSLDESVSFFEKVVKKNSSIPKSIWGQTITSSFLRECTGLVWSRQIRGNAAPSYNNLKDKPLTEDYQRAKYMWSRFDIKTMRAPLH